MTLPDILEPDEGFFHVDSVGGEFGVTAELVPWQAIVDYQEKNGTPRQGYFRLCRHPYVRRLEARVARSVGWPVAQAFCSPEAALAEVVDFLAVETGESPTVLWTGVRPIRLGNFVVATGGVGETPPAGCTHWVVSVPGEGCEAGVVVTSVVEHGASMWDRLKKRGATLSARDAAALCGVSTPVLEGDPRATVLKTLMDWEGAGAGWLFSTGMAALVGVFEALVTEARPRVIVMGHLYSDTHVILGELPWAWGPLEAEFLQADETARLESLLDDRTAMVFVETVTNPLIEVPDLPMICAICVNHSVPLVVDNTMATPINLKPLAMSADVVVHSTTKYFSGTNNHGGGVVLVRNATSELAGRLAERRTDRQDDMSPREAAVLAGSLPTFPERMERFNENGRAVADFLRAHGAVARVYFPEELPSWLGGAGSVVSFTLEEDSLEALVDFYETPMPSIRKAPTLGSDKTLLCPYTLLTYYHRDDEYLADIRLPRHLLRIAVGCEENLDAVFADLNRALSG